MPIVRCNFFFQQQGYGWTETYWTTGTDTDIRQYFDKADTLAKKRAILSGKETFLEAVRLSAEGVFRDATGVTYPGDGLKGKADQISDAPATALLIGMKNAAATKARNIFLRGVWDACVDEGGRFKPTDAYTGYLNQFFAELTQAAPQTGWGWLGAVTRVPGNVTTVTQDLSGTVLINLASDVFPGPFPQDTSVRISGVLGATQINGQQIVRATAPRVCSTRRRISIFPYTTGGKLTYNAKDYIPAFVCSPKRIVERKPGRPSYRSAGRQRARAAS